MAWSLSWSSASSFTHPELLFTSTSCLELELESNFHSNTIKIVNYLEKLQPAVQDIQISQKLLNYLVKVYIEM